MKTKICSSFWSDPDIENVTTEIRLTALWLETNERVSLFGYAEFTLRRFEFETGLTAEALGKTFEALSNRYKKTTTGYWVRNYIREQFGDGEALEANNLFKAIERQFLACTSVEVVELVTNAYPSLSRLSLHPLAKPLASSTQVQRAGAGVSTGASASVSAGASAGQGSGPKPRKAKVAKPGSVIPSEQPEPVAHRMIAIGALMGRREATPWTANEHQAFLGARLADASQEDFNAQVDLMRAYYQKKIPREQDFRRRELQTLLNNWPGELDKARAFSRDNNDGITKL